MPADLSVCCNCCEKLLYKSNAKNDIGGYCVSKTMPLMKRICSLFSAQKTEDRFINANEQVPKGYSVKSNASDKNTCCIMPKKTKQK